MGSGKRYAARVACGTLCSLWIVATAPGAARAAQHCYDVAWNTTGAGTATGHLEIDDDPLDNPGSGTNSWSVAPQVWTSFVVTITGASSGNGTFTVGTDFNAIFDIGPGALDREQELVAQGGVSDFNVLGGAPAPTGIAPNTFTSNGFFGDVFTLASITPKSCVPFPVDSDAAKCQDAIGKSVSKYFSTRHKILAKCRSSLMQGNALFEDEAETIPVVLGTRCADELKSAAAIAKARQKLRDGVAKSCTDTLLVGLRSCDTTVDGLADATGTTGCLVTATDNRIEALIEREYGF